ncbi:pyridoxal phosphate-dependent transferase, partial [Podospora didyma]
KKNGYTFIPQDVRSSAEFKRATAKTSKAVQETARMLGQHSIPFWSPRYQAHMCTDLAMPALLGYFMTMIYNPNNITLEASPISTVAEIEVGEQLCNLFGFNNNLLGANEPTAWAHITCDGTVANLESMWVARNLKYYPLSLRKAMDDPEGTLQFVPDTFSVRTCQGRLKRFRDLSTWELLNLKLKTVLDMPAQLYRDYGITPTFLQGALDKYNIQTVGKGVLEKHFDMEDVPKYFVAGTKHYSWPKAGAIVGIGSENIVSVPIDNSGRIDIGQLEKRLEENLKSQTAVLGAVAVIGSTEEGAVDPLRKILALRQRFQALGLSFMVHADSAWGGYFATMLPRGDSWKSSIPGRDGGDSLVPDLSLRVETQEDLFALRYCDSITVDPHKAGYIPYPAGALAYRDGRIKNLVTWTAPYLSRGADTSMGIYGVEGSADEEQFSALWAALSTPDDDFVCTPFNMLPSEASGRPELVEEEKQRIRDEILSKTNAEIIASDRDKNTMALLRALGSDLNINLFALNWRYPDGCLNTDVEEANDLMTRIIKRLSVDDPEDKPTRIPMYLTTAELSPDVYGGGCLENFKKRLGLEHDSGESLMVFRNVVMSPLASFSAKDDFINMLGDTFRRVVEEEVKASCHTHAVCQKRNEDKPDYHSFWVRGTDKIFLSYGSMFRIAKHRQQVILGVEFDRAGDKAYRELVGNTDDDIVLKTAHKVDLGCLLENFRPGKDICFWANLTTKSNGVVAPHIGVHITSLIKSRPLNRSAQDDNFPAGFMPFYLYGTEKERHIDHVLVQAPNITLSAENVALVLNDNSVDIEAVIQRGAAIVTLEGVHEAALQPFPETNEELFSGTGNCNFFFRQGAKFDVKVWEDPRGPTDGTRGMLAEMRRDQKKPLGTGTLTLGENVLVDVEKVNRDPFAEAKTAKVSKWRERFDRIGREVRAVHHNEEW